MNTQETIIQLKELKLKGMANTLESLMTLPVQSRPSFDFAIAKMVGQKYWKGRNVKQKCSSKPANSATVP